MLNEIADNCNVYLVTGYTDMRKGIDGLAAIVQGKLMLNPFDKSLFLFCGRNRSKMKGLLWEGDGFLLLYKRLVSAFISTAPADRFPPGLQFMIQCST